LPLEKTLNEIKKEIFDTVYAINEKYEVENETSRIIFFFGTKATWYIKTNVYSVKDIHDEKYFESSNHYWLTILSINLKKILCQKKLNPDLRLVRNWK
jgi:hypothetical protein